MDRKEMIEALVLNALNYFEFIDLKGAELDRRVKKEREYLEKKTDLELQNMVLINC